MALKKKIISIIIFLIIIIGGIFFFYFLNLSAPSSAKIEKIIEIKSGSSANTIANLLQEKKLIKNKNIFLLYLKLNKINPQAGTYQMYTNFDVKTIAKKINDGDTFKNTYKIRLIEGKTLKNYAIKYAEVTNDSQNKIISLLENKNYLNSLIDKYWFLTADILDPKIYFPLEGYLFPDTYEFYANSSIEIIINKQLSNLAKKLEPHREYIIENNLNVHDIITLASIIEKEANTASERKLVAGVFYNRLNNNIHLGSDVTTYYAEQVEMGSVKDLYMSQYAEANDYNTRNVNFIGLPVGPICNPSLSSIEAAIYPDETNYYYFYADKNGKIYFARTLNEHNNNINKYRSE